MHLCVKVNKENLPRLNKKDKGKEYVENCLLHRFWLKIFLDVEADENIEREEYIYAEY